MQTALIEPAIAIKKTTYEPTINTLTQVLSDEHILYIKLRNYHWNVEGVRHRDLHALFEDQYRVIEVRIDEVAERIRALGASAAGTMTEYLQKAMLHEIPGARPTAKEMLCDLLYCHETVIRFLREALTSGTHSDLDVGSVDLLTGLIRDHEKMAWTLRASLPEDQSVRQTRRESRPTVLYD